MIAISLFIQLDVQTRNVIAIAQEKDRLNQCFDKAIDDATHHLVEIDGIDSLHVSKEGAVNAFFLSIYASLSIVDNPLKQEELKKFIPIIVITVEDGFYLNFSDEYLDEHSYKTLIRNWSEKLPYYYEDDDFIYRFTMNNEFTLLDKHGLISQNIDENIYTLDFNTIKSDEKYEEFRSKRPNSFLLAEEKFALIRKESIIKSIEKSLIFYCNKYNQIATHFGINYVFSIPPLDNSEWERTIDNPSMIVLFQGYPYGAGAKQIFNRISIAGASVKKGHVFYIEQKEWYLLYHKDDCPILKNEGIIHLTKPYYRLYDCVKEGAYACSTCNETGAFPPEYIPGR